MFALGILQGNGHGECRAFSLFTFRSNLAVHHLHKALGNSHAQTGTSVFSGVGSILLGEGIENLGQELFVYAYTGILYLKTQGRFFVKAGNPFYRKINLAAFRRELDRIAQDVEEDLPQLHVIADVIIVDMPVDITAVPEPFLVALTADQGIDLFQKMGNGKLFVLQGRAAGFDPRHIEDIVDQLQQMTGRAADLFQIILRRGGNPLLIESDSIQADDGVHRRTNLVAHVGKEGCFGFVSLFGYGQRIAEGLVLRHGLPGFLVNVREAYPHRMDHVVIPVFRMAHAGHAQHLIGFLPVAVHQIAVTDNRALFQSRPDGFRLNKRKETFPVTVRYVFLRIGGKNVVEGKTFPFFRGAGNGRPGTDALALVAVQIHIINAAVIRSQRRDHLILLCPLLFLLQQLFLQF